MSNTSLIPDEKRSLKAAAERRQWINLLLVYGALAAGFGVTGILYLHRYPLGTIKALAEFLCLMFLLGLFLVPGFEVSRSWVAARFQGRSWALASLLLFLSPYLLYAAGTDDFHWIAVEKLLLIAGLPLCLYSFFPVRSPHRICWQDVLVLLSLVAPLFLRRTGQIWNVPVNLDFMVRLFIAGVAAWSLILWRRLEDVGYQFSWSWSTTRVTLFNFAAVTVTLPLSWAMRFSEWNPKWNGPARFIFDYITIFIFIALPEELLFRGGLQNLLEKTWVARYRAQAVASVLFGVYHIMIAPVPNWHYVILAAIAGWFYGSAYRASGSIVAAATVHAMVDLLRRTWFLPH